MKHHLNITRGVLLALALAAVSCGRNETTAVKSAAAHREALEKGVPVGGGHDHGGHDAAAATGTVDHSVHAAATTGTMDHSAHAAATTGTMDHSAHAATGAVDHAAMGHGTTKTDPHAGHTASANAHAQHGAPAAAGNVHAGHGATPRAGTTHATSHGQHAGTQTAAGDPHAQHRPRTTTAQPADHSAHGATQTRAPAPSEPAGLTPAAPQDITLQPDPFDAPAPSSVAEAAKASQGSGHEGHQQTVYVCPMHPEVTSDKPGKCPKCAMTLVKKQ